MRRFAILTFALSLLFVGCERQYCDGLEVLEKTIVLNASTTDQSKASLGDGNVILWSSGDGLSVFEGGYNRRFSLVTGAGDASATFSGTVSSTASELYALSPYSSSASYSSGVISGVSLPSAQTAVAGSFDPATAIMVTYTDDVETLRFHHVPSYIKCATDFDCSEIVLSSVDGSVLAGSVKIVLEDDGTPQRASVSDGASTSVTLSGNIQTGKKYLIAVAPGLHSYGLDVKFVAKSGICYSRRIPGPLTLKSGHISNIGTLSKNGDWDSVETVSLSRKAVGMVEGNTFTLSAIAASPSVSLSGLTWSSSDSSIATVNGGVVTARKAGSCEITATLAGISTSCKITVIASSSSVYRHGYSELNSSEKAAYDYMLKQIFEYEANSAEYGDYSNRVYLDFSSVGYYPTKDQLMRLTNIIINDVPEAYPITSYIYRYDYDRYKYYIRMTKAYTPELYAEQMAQVYETTDAMLEALPSGGSDFDKAKSLHDSFIRATNYGDITGTYAGNLVGGFVNHRAVCEGYARSYLFLCQRAGLKVIYIGGALQTSSSPETWVNHAWNHIKIGDNWYMSDLTSDGGLVGTLGYRYFLLGQSSATTIHKYSTTDGGDPNTGTYGYLSLPALSQNDYPMSR